MSLRIFNGNLYWESVSDSSDKFLDDICYSVKFVQTRDNDSSRRNKKRELNGQIQTKIKLDY